jgi:hypothetical protein
MLQLTLTASQGAETEHASWAERGPKGFAGPQRAARAVSRGPIGAWWCGISSATSSARTAAVPNQLRVSCSSTPTSATSGGTCRSPTSTHGRNSLPRPPEAGAAQDAFWPMHDLLLDHQDDLRAADVLKYANELALNPDRFHDDLKRHVHEARIAQHVESADLSGGIRYAQVLHQRPTPLRRLRHPNAHAPIRAARAQAKNY